MSFKSIIQNPDILNIVLLMLGPHAMSAVKAMEDFEHAAEDTEWYSYFDVLKKYGLNDPYDWHVEQFGSNQYVAVYNGKPLSTFDTFYWMGSDPTSVGGRNPTLVVQDRREGPAPLTCWWFANNSRDAHQFDIIQVNYVASILCNMLEKRESIGDLPFPTNECLFVFYPANASTWIDPYHWRYT